MRLIAYIRVSQVGDRSGASFISPDIQAEQIKAKARLGGHEVVGAPIQDLDETGGNLKRPGWERAVEQVMSGRADGIAVAKLDRFSRNLRDALGVIEQFEAAGKVIVSAAEDFDPTTPMGRFARDLVIRMAQMERERLAEGWRIARGHAVENGVHAARAPFGYRRNADRRLEPDPDAAPIVRELFERRAAGETWFALCKWLDEVAPRPKGGAWPQTTLTNMIANETYIGHGEAGSRHEAIIPRALFERAQRDITIGRYVANPRLLTGIAKCASCDGLMTRTTDGHGYSAYRCRGRRGVGVCTRPARVSTRLADEYVEQAFLSRLRVLPVELVNKPRAADQGAVVRLELAEAELSAYRDETLISVIGKDAYAAGLAQRQRAVDDAREAVRHSTTVEPDAVRFNLLEEWSELPLEARREVIGTVTEAVLVKPGHKVGKVKPGRSTLPLADRIEIRWQEQWGEALAAAAVRAFRSARRSAQDHLDVTRH